MEDKSYYSYFGILQTDIERVIDFTAHFTNMYNYCKNKYTEEQLNEGQISTEDRIQTNQINQNLRYYATRVFIKMSALQKIKEIKDNYSEFELLYNEISYKKIVSLETVIKFSICINRMLVGSVLENLLMESNQYIQQYAAPQTDSTTPDLNQL